MGLLEINKVLNSPRLFFAALTSASIATLSTTYFLEIFQNLPPCVLCLYQRIPYLITTCLCALGWYLSGSKRRSQLPRILIRLSAVTLLAGTGLAGYHVGVEYGIWQGTTRCSALGVDAVTVSALKSAILSAPIANCADVLWSFMGLSLAEWNLLWSTLLAIVCIYVLKRLRQ